MKKFFLPVLFISWTAQAQAANSDPSTEANVPPPTSEGIAVATSPASPEIYLVPIGLIEWDITSNTWGSMFGLIGALLEQSATGEDNARTAQSLSATLEKSVAPRRLFAYQLSDELKSCGKIPSIWPEEVSTDIKFSEWGDIKVPQINYANTGKPVEQYFVEAGIAKFWIDKSLLGSTLRSTARIKIFDQDGNYLDYFTDNTGLTGSVTLKNEPYANSEQTISELEGAIKSVVAGMSKKLSLKLCAFKK